MRTARIGDFTVKPVKASTMEEHKDVPDVVFICVKYYSLDEAVAFLKSVVSKETIVISILNVFGLRMLATIFKWNLPKRLIKNKTGDGLFPDCPIFCLNGPKSIFILQSYGI